MTHNASRYIVEDLLPLYVEGLLSDETTKWLEDQIQGNPEYEQLLELSRQPLPEPEILSTVGYESMMKRINRKLSWYQIIFIAMSFYLAISTSLLNESFGFIGSYTVLGLVTYLFYKDIKLVSMIAFVPIFIWSFGDSVLDTNVLYALLGALLLAFMHFLFAFVGSVMGWLIIQIKK